MAQRFNVSATSDGGVEIVVDRETAVLIKDALDIINPDQGEHEEWARTCSFQLELLLERTQ